MASKPLLPGDRHLNDSFIRVFWLMKGYHSIIVSRSHIFYVWLFNNSLMFNPTLLSFGKATPNKFPVSRPPPASVVGQQ